VLRLLRPGRARVGTLLAAVALALAAVPAARAAAPEAGLGRLTLEVERVEAIRAVKRLQKAYAQYAQFGLWREMADLFAADAELIHGDDRVRGPDAVRRYLLRTLGGGRAGLAPGGLNTRMIVRPIVTLAPDGMTARGRWSEFAMTGRYGGEAGWSGGIYENEYVRQRGVWKIARLHYFPMFAGPYETGWRNVDGDLEIIPYHFTPDQAGTPVPPLPAGAGAGRAAPLAELERRARTMVEEDAVLNLQNAYGFYVDRKMWDDVTDLFTADGVLEVSDVGVYAGVAGIRRALERDGPAGLKEGELNEHVLFDTIVAVAPSGVEARARGLEFTQLGDNATGRAAIGVATFESRFVKQGGIWRIREMRRFPMMKTDYDQGWHRSRLVEPAPPPAFVPDRPSPNATAEGEAPVVPEFFYPHPVTGRAVRYLSGTRVVGRDRLAPAVAVAAERAPSGPAAARMAEVRRKLAVAVGYDAAENLASAFGTWNDDLQWDKFSALFARRGWRGKSSVGFYIGPERIYRAETISRGVSASPRTSSELHFRMQPVIHVAPDGRSARIRSRYFHLGTRLAQAGTFAAGIYSNDAAVLEDGVWKLSNAAIDDGYFSSTSYKDGWARARPPSDAAAAGRLSGATARMVAEMPPDVPIAAMPFRQQGFIPGAIIAWPRIKPMWFHYPNPVSGRLPPFYCPDEHTCDPAFMAAGGPPQ
jgi:hypothetical protein